MIFWGDRPIVQRTAAYLGSYFAVVHSAFSFRIQLQAILSKTSSAKASANRSFLLPRSFLILFNRVALEPALYRSILFLPLVSFHGFSL